MTSRSCFMGVVVVVYGTLTTTTSLFVSDAVARTAGHAVIPVFLTVFVILCVAAALAGGRLLTVFVRVWAQHWNEHGVSWAVAEAEQILTRAKEQR